MQRPHPWNFLPSKRVPQAQEPSYGEDLGIQIPTDPFLSGAYLSHNALSLEMVYLRTGVPAKASNTSHPQRWSWYLGRSVSCSSCPALAEIPSWDFLCLAHQDSLKRIFPRIFEEFIHSHNVYRSQSSPCLPPHTSYIPLPPTHTNFIVSIY